MRIEYRATDPILSTTPQRDVEGVVQLQETPKTTMSRKKKVILFVCGVGAVILAAILTVVIVLSFVATPGASEINGTAAPLIQDNLSVPGIPISSGLFPTKNATCGDRLKLSQEISSSAQIMITKKDGDVEELIPLPNLVISFVAGTHDVVVFKQPGTFHFSITSGSTKVEEDINVTGSVFTKADAQKEAGSIVVIPRNVYRVEKDAFVGNTKLTAIVRDVYGGARPENCDFGKNSSTGKYIHIPVFSVDFDNIPKFAIPDTRFMKGRGVPFLQTTKNSTAEKIKINGSTFTCSNIGHCFHTMNLGIGSYTAYCDGTACGSFQVVNWSETDSNYGIPENAAEESIALEIPYGAYQIADNQYYKNTKIKSVHIPETVKYIGNWAFHYSSLSELDLRHGAKEVIFGAFMGTKIENIVVPASIDFLDGRTFYGCESLRVAVMEEGLTEVSDEMFLRTTSLESIVLPSTITRIGDGAFCASGISEIRIPDSVISIESMAFSSAESLRNFKVGKGVETIGQMAFSKTYGLRSFEFNSKVQELSESLFESSGIGSIVIPSNIRRIKRFVFRTCPNLHTVELREGLEEIGDNAFQDTPLDSLYIPSSVMTIGKNPLLYSTIKQITSGTGKYRALGSELYDSSTGELISFLCYGPSADHYTFSNNIKILGEKASHKCTNVRSLEFSSTIQEVKSNYCESCTNLEKLVLNEGLKAIGANTFTYSSLVSLTIPSTVNSIGEDAFYNSQTIREVVLSEGIEVMEFGNGIFLYCHNLSSFTLPSTIRKVTGTSVLCKTNIPHLTVPSRLWSQGEISKGFFCGSYIEDICCVLEDGQAPQESLQFNTGYLNDPYWVSPSFGKCGVSES